MPRAASSVGVGRRLLATRGIAARRSHVTLTVTLARLLALRSFQVQSSVSIFTHTMTSYRLPVPSSKQFAADCIFGRD